MKLTLSEIAHARSGDKGSQVNIGLFAYNEKGYSFLENRLTLPLLLSYFSPLSPTQIIRYDLPNLYAFNIILKGVLKGGASECLFLDSQGKSLGQALLNLELELTEEEMKEAGSYKETK